MPSPKTPRRLTAQERNAQRDEALTIGATEHFLAGLGDARFDAQTIGMWTRNIECRVQITALCSQGK